MLNMLLIYVFSIQLIKAISGGSSYSPPKFFRVILCYEKIIISVFFNQFVDRTPQNYFSVTASQPTKI